MYDDLMEKDPKMQKIFAESYAKGYAKGEAKALRKGIVRMVQTHFPAVADLAQQRANQLNKSEELHTLFKQIVMAHNEQEVRAILSSPLI